MAGDEIILADEDVQFAGGGHAVGLIENGEVQHDEKVVIVIVDLWALHPAEHIVQRQRVEVEIVLQVLNFFLGRFFDIVPCHLSVAANRVDAACIDSICYLCDHFSSKQLEIF